jgi:glutamine amidotransferase
MKIVILDLNLGNLKSIERILNLISDKLEIEISNEIDILNKADKLIIAGVGAFDTAISNIESLNLRSSLDDFKNSGKPILGICLGMQLMTEYSEEGSLKGLGWIKGSCKKFSNKLLNVPHMGWNTVEYDKQCPLYLGIPHFTEKSPRFYFVHSYYVDLHSNNYRLGKTLYGDFFPASFSNNNLYGVQFHPEKSLKYGVAILSNFIDL